MLRLILSVFALSVIAALPTSGQSCRVSDATSTRFLAHVRTIASSSDPTWTAARTALSMPAVSSSQVAPETRASVCKKAAEAYDRELQRLQATAPQARQIDLVKVGNYYVATDRTARSPGSEWSTLILLTGQYAFVSAWGQ